MSGEIERLLEIMRALRDPQQGCPWDREQSYRTIVPHTLEEAYEVADAIERNDLKELRGELGDLLFQVVFYAQIASEEGEFSFDEVVMSINEKLIRRHPHVFADAIVEDSDSQTEAWEQLKSEERRQKGGDQESVLDGVLAALPALTRAAKVQRKAVRVGFDWPEVSGVLDKVEEEFAELRQELEADSIDQQLVDEEMGDLLFSVVNLCRHLKLDGEGALRRATNKFESRFRAMEQQLTVDGKELRQLSIDEMESAWREVKAEEGG